MGAHLRLAYLLLVLTLAVLPLAALQLLVVRAAPARRAVLPQLFHRIFLHALGIRSFVHGAPARGGVLFVSNHVSFADIPALGSVLGAVFVAKGEMASWPVVSSLARAHGIIFVKRQAVRQARAQASELASRLLRGEEVILFPEGTTSNGKSVLPFKPALFTAVEQEGAVAVQPITLLYSSRRTGSPANVGWDDDSSLFQHMMQILREPRFDVRLTFHSAVSPGDFADRKALAEHSRERVLAGLLPSKAA